MAIITSIVELPQRGEAALFDGTFAQDRAGLDIPASVAAYNLAWLRRVEAAYPDAAVRLSATALRVVVCPQPRGSFDPGEDEQAIQALAEGLFEAGDLWMVEA